MLDLVELVRKSMMIENPMAEAAQVQRRYAQYTPCRRCAGRVEDDPSPVADVCSKCAALVAAEATELLYDQMLEGDWGILDDLLRTTL